MQYGPKIVTDRLVLALDASDRNSYIGSGSTWKDLSGNGYNCNLQNSPTFSSTNLGNFSFNGVNQFGDVTNTLTAFNFSNTTFTLSLWLKTSSNLNVGIVSKGGSTGGWSLWSLGGTATARLLNGSSSDATYASSIASIIDNKWHNVTVIYTTSTTVAANSNVQIYIDGYLNQGAVTKLFTYGTEAVTMNLSRRSTSYWLGSIASVQIYNRGLSAAEVLQNYNATKSRFGL